MATNLRPFRDYDEHDVVNLFAFSGSYPQTKGAIVTIMGNGWKNTDEPFDMAGGAGAAYGNTVSQRYGLNAYVRQCASGETPLGMTIHDVRETDENGEKLLYNPQKQEELQAMLPGQAVPVATKGIFTLSSAAFDGPISSYAPGNRIKLSAVTAGKVTGFTTIAQADITTGDFRIIDLFSRPFNFNESLVQNRVKDCPIGSSVKKEIILIEKKDVPTTLQIIK